MVSASWRTHSCVPRRDSSRRLFGSHPLNTPPHTRQMMDPRAMPGFEVATIKPWNSDEPGHIRSEPERHCHRGDITLEEDP
jgi:hypothetical protein